MKRLLGLIIAFMLFVGMVGTGSWAYFTDPEYSTDNPMAAGTLDLKTDDADGVTQTIYATSLKRGDSISGNITLKNIGTNDGPVLDVFFSYLENDDTPNTVDMSDNYTAAVLEITALNYDGTDLLSGVSDSNGNFYKDIEDIANADLSNQTGLDAQESKLFEITVKLNDNTDNDFQGDGVTITITFCLNQWGS